MIRLVFSALLILVTALPGLAANRYALVIGNDDYTEVPDLQKAVNDAVSVSDTLTAQGFDVLSLTNATRRDMNRGISEFTGRLQPGDTAVVFFAGHGVEIGGENYLLPTDVVTPTSGDPGFIISESIGLSGFLDRVRATGARTTLAFIDACRENPFATATGRSIGGARGLGRIAAPEGTFVVFSAGAGQLALDRLSDTDPDPNSVFTRALLPRLNTPGLELRDLIKQVRVDVRDMALGVDHAQFPAYYDELLGEYYFDVTPAAAPAPAADPAPAAQDSVREDFNLARSLGTRAALQAFLNRHATSDDDFVLDLARDMLAALPAETAAAPVPAPEPEPTPEPATRATDTRALVREVQGNLNRLGCNAGPADGIAGARTRSAFARFLSETGTPGLAAADLATPAALTALRAQSGRVCPVVSAAAPAPDTATPTPVQSAAGPSLAGTWNYSAACPFFITVTGSIQLFAAENGRFNGPIADSLGQNGRTTVQLVGRTLQGRNNWSHGVVETWSGTLAGDGRSFTLRASSGCTATATKG